jgi:hypothetical protein
MATEDDRLNGQVTFPTPAGTVTLDITASLVAESFPQ